MTKPDKDLFAEAAARGRRLRAEAAQEDDRVSEAMANATSVGMTVALWFVLGLHQRSSFPIDRPCSDEVYGKHYCRECSRPSQHNNDKVIWPCPTYAGVMAGLEKGSANGQ